MRPTRVRRRFRSGRPARRFLVNVLLKPPFPPRLTTPAWVLRPHPGKTTAEVHDYHDTATGVLASSLAKRAPGYTSLGSPDPRQ